MEHTPLMLKSKDKRNYQTRCSCGWESKWTWLDYAHAALTEHIISKRKLEVNMAL